MHVIVTPSRITQYDTTVSGNLHPPVYGTPLLQFTNEGELHRASDGHRRAASRPRL